MKNKTVLVVFTGGTISMEKDQELNRAVIADNNQKLFDHINPELDNVNLISHSFSLKPSPSMTPDDMFRLAKLVESYLEKPLIDGVVITHGTDTLEESAYFLHLFLDTDKPVVFTGSMRNFSELGFDGLSNLVSSIRVATAVESIGLGILVVLNDEINSASEVTKTHTLSLDTFKSLEFGPLGIVEQENVLYYRKAHQNNKLIRPENVDSQIYIVNAYAGASSLILNLLIENGANGIVLESLGRGNIPPAMLAGVTRAIENDIPVLITSRCPMGRVLDSYGYEGGGYHLKKLGVIFTENLNSQKARIKLILVLGLKTSSLNVKSYF